jgi:hypothetical protein
MTSSGNLLLVTANVVPSSLILFPLILVAMRSSETSNRIHHSHRSENLKSHKIPVIITVKCVNRLTF